MERRHGSRGVILALFLALVVGVRSEEHRYKRGDPVPLLANKIGPYANPSVTYQYYELPFCQPKEGKQYILEHLGEVLEGDRLVSTPYDIRFRVDVESQALCTKELDSTDLEDLREAVLDDYYFQMFFDDHLPVWGFVGKVEQTPAGAADDEGDGDGETRIYVFSHFHFDIAYNEDRVIEVNVSTVSSDPNKTQDITSGDALKVTFTYSVKWHESAVEFEDRMGRFTHYSKLPHHLEIHWFAIVNSCVTVLLLTGFLATILLRVLKNDFIKMARLPDEEGGINDDDALWKNCHGDVFRFPADVNLFSAMVGVGTQVLVILLCVLGLSLMDLYYPYNRGGMLTSCVILYALTSGIAGYVSGIWYKRMGGSLWLSNVLLCAFLFCGPLLVVFSVLNTIAWIEGSTQALPFGTICIIIVIWALVTFPLTVFGGVVANNSPADYSPPCRVNKVPREVPQLPWYKGVATQMVLAGFLPFSAIYVELYYIFATIWGHKLYTIYSILFIVFIILIIVTAFVTVALTYFQLSSEDHRWWWRSYLCGGSTALFMYVYCFFYWEFRTDMSGLMQAAFYFGYNAIACYAFFLMLGAVGWFSAHVFVSRIYQAVKAD